MKRLVLLALSFPTLAFALHDAPWYGEFLELYFSPGYEYNFFDRVENGRPQLSSTFHTHVARAQLGVTAPPSWNFELELEFADTSSVDFGYRSFAIQGRKLWLDDVCGDPVSLSTGLSYRDASTRMRRALSTPYHGRANFEGHISVGKEWSSGCYWFFRTYGMFAVGQATSGSPWLRGDLTFDGNVCDEHYFSIYAHSYWGLGSKTVVNTVRFTGWEDIRHQSIDLGASYAYRFELWGNLKLEYRRRVYAHSYPEGVNFFLLTYSLPFCPF